MSTLESLDDAILRAVYGEPGSAAVRWFMIALTIVGNGTTFFGLLALTPFARTRRVAISLGLTLGVTYAISSVLKWLVGRIRPFHALPDIKMLYGWPTDPSFPSGHAAGNFALAGFMIGLARMDGSHPRTRIAAIGLTIYAGLVAYSRMYLGAHYPTDVLGGALIGTVLGLFGARITARHRRVSAREPGWPSARPASRPS